MTRSCFHWGVGLTNQLVMVPAAKNYNYQNQAKNDDQNKNQEKVIGNNYQIKATLKPHR